MKPDSFPHWLEKFIEQQNIDPKKVIDFHGGKAITPSDIKKIITGDEYKDEWPELKTTLGQIVEAGNDPLCYLSYHIQETRMLSGRKPQRITP